MNDQAERLRKIALEAKYKIEQEIVRELKYTRVVVISSGKGGVGKSTLALNMALSLCNHGKKVILLDADLGLANIDIMLGLIPQNNIFDMVQGRKHLQDIIIKGPDGLAIIPGGSGITELANLNKQDLTRIIAELGKIDGQYDYMLIDTGAGISDNVISFLLSADELVLVTTPEPTALTDAYGLIKTVARQSQDKKCYLVVNRVESNTEGVLTAEKFKLVCQRFLNLKIEFLGHIVNEPTVGEGIRRQRAFIKMFPQSIAAKNVENITRSLINYNERNNSTSFSSGGIRKFFKKIMGMV